MDEKKFETPKKTGITKKLVIPASPFLKTLGYGTGVKVYEFVRSPLADRTRSPWALKKVTNRNKRDTVLSQRLHSEAEILKKLKHPNIIGFRAYLKSPEGNILAMEECTISLGDLIENRRDDGNLTRCSVDEIMKIGKDISSALNYLHNTALLLHCDIKSFNILVKNNFETNKLCDFGSCLPLNKDGTVDSSKTGGRHEYVGTVAWSAPEVLKYPPEITWRADIYSFGLVLYEMLTLEIPINETINESFSSNEDNGMELDDSNCFILPDIDVGEEYHIILELMHRCASHLKEDRPEANELEIIFEKCLNNLKI